VKTRILLVDDFKPWRVAASRILGSSPEVQIVGEASDGVEAIEKAASLLPDVVLLDIGLPLLNGLQAAPQIRQASPRSKIIFLTGQDDDDLRNAALAAGAEAYVVKSRALAELQLSLEAAVRQTRETSSSFGFSVPSLSTP
jgi:DNA-binding NarL/FixJ family response regulator